MVATEKEEKPGEMGEEVEEQSTTADEGGNGANTPPNSSCNAPRGRIPTAASYASLCSGRGSSPDSDDDNTTPTQIITEGKKYIQGIKIYGIGIMEDPVPGEKRGRGMQHLTSSYWIYDMGVFICRSYAAMQAMARYAFERTEQYPGHDFRYFTNVSNALFLKAEAEGLRTREGRDFFLMACWLAMAAAEVDGFGYDKYSPEKRAAQREAFYQKYLNPETVWPVDEKDDENLERILGPYAIESCRMDMIPSVALERLGIHNELCALKWSDPNKWMREGFKVSARVDSMKRHYESIHARDESEDHIAHLIWGFMAITHVVAVFPQMNDLHNFEALRRQNVKAEGARTIALVGDGGFRPVRRKAHDRFPEDNCAPDHNHQRNATT